MRRSEDVSYRCLFVPAASVDFLTATKATFAGKPCGACFCAYFCQDRGVHPAGGAIYRLWQSRLRFVSQPAVIPTAMKPISPEALKLVHDKTPLFLPEVQQAKQKGQGTRKSARLVVSLDRFEDDPFQLYSCLWYAHSEGVDVLVAAPAAQPPQK